MSALPLTSPASSSSSPASPAAEGTTSHAIVLGAGITGLVVARVLADHFERVTIVERDRLPEAPEVRAGVPQAHHAHILLTRGRQELERLFPGITDELVEAGSVWFDYTADTILEVAGHRAGRTPSGIVALGATRALFEWHVRRRVAAHGQIDFVDGTVASSLVVEDGEVVGVRLRAAKDRPIGRAEMRAALVVDATGRTSKAPQWIHELTGKSIPKTTVDARVTYASRLYKLPPGLDWKAVAFGAQWPDRPYAGTFITVEGGRLLATLIGIDGEAPPTDDAGFVAFAGRVRDPILRDTMLAAEPVSTIHGFGGLKNRRTHFEAVRGWPAGFVVLGDAVCIFNPIYAAGMTVSILSAVELGHVLTSRGAAPGAAPPADVAAIFQRRLAKVTRYAWSVAVREDRRWCARDERSGLERFLHAYTDRTLELIERRPDVVRDLLRVIHLVGSPLRLLRPSIALPVLARTLFGEPIEPKPTLHGRPWDRFLANAFLLLTLVSVTLDLYLALGVPLDAEGGAFARFLNATYVNQVDPSLLAPTPQLRAMGFVNAFAFGPFYLLLFHALRRKRAWIRPWALLYSGAMIFNMTVVFVSHWLNGRHGHELAFVVCNGVYLVLPILLAIRFRSPIPFPNRPGAQS